jgi:hypothetical protein
VGGVSQRIFLFSEATQADPVAAPLNIWNACLRCISMKRTSHALGPVNEHRETFAQSVGTSAQHPYAHSAPVTTKSYPFLGEQLIR